ncbi:CubicO group peptidase, beta-lactamase class C family [Nonomuraea maritima]|uniref:CubicO group peptidase, beta-lactamase class C family n=1 Tax=Nonomuraea maritima TaxID=683260 RepID=A0A1G9KZ89_9ACTN|nr:serine hydrolase domain-containing protein [Nonomuraea maritima]SDL54757.1 CubicO group peptidase, beta-lactamase class C family [Nonomuraea maritima]
MSLTRERMAALVAAAGYDGDEPIAVGMRRHGAPPVEVAQGLTSGGARFTTTTTVYAASLAKQMTAACAALLVRRGVLDTDSPLSRWMPELPSWSATVRLHHLLHHTAALPDSWTDDRTTRTVVQALARTPSLEDRPGTRYVYSNAGYVCLAVIVERAARKPLPDFAHDHLFRPLGMAGTHYWPGPAPAPPGATPLSPAPLSLGDGGVWTSLRDLLRWSEALNADELGVSALMQTPGRLDDGTPVDYAWGMGVRSLGPHRVYRHGGGWSGLRALQARVPALGLSVALIAIRDNTERRVALLDGLLDEATRIS